MPNTLESLTKMGFSETEAQNILSAATPEQVENLIKSGVTVASRISEILNEVGDKSKEIDRSYPNK